MNSQKQLDINIEKVKPKLIGQKCPVCSGFGRVNWQKQICHGCSGKGYILVPAEEVKSDY